MSIKGTWNGSCHCGAVRFRIAAEIHETTSCDCSLCRRRNAVMAQVHHTELEILAGEDGLALYQWNLKIARHHFCKVCGIYTFHRKRSAPDHYGVNIFCLEGFDRTAVPHRQADGVGMTVEADGARAEWTGPREA
jgi:hypothetical protein